MDTLDFALRMLPMWILGLFMVFVTVMSGNTDLMRVQKSSVFRWMKFLVGISIVRFALFYFKWDMFSQTFEDVSWLPLGTVSMVWWEDMAHTMPLLLLGRLIGYEKKTWPIHIAAFLIIWLAFASGHIYQGIGSAILISMYIPYAFKLSKEKGLGTLMVCHILYDFTTLALIKGMLRYM